MLLGLMLTCTQSSPIYAIPKPSKPLKTLDVIDDKLLAGTTISQLTITSTVEARKETEEVG